MGFRLRLALLFVATLVAVQVLTALLVYGVARRALIAEGERQLETGAVAVARQLDDISTRVADNVQVLSLDFALRTAIAQNDQDTVLSALRNHGRRIGAERMLLLGLDGAVRSDTSSPASGGTFPFPDLADAAFEHPAAAVVALGGKAYWMIVVPVYAPKPIALIAAGIPVDHALLSRLQQLSVLPNALELVSDAGDNHWSGIAHGDNPVELAPAFAATGLPLQPTLLSTGSGEYVALATRLKNAERSAPVAAVLSYSLDDALRPYHPVALAWASFGVIGLGIGLIGAMLIARGVARPIEQLAAVARRVGTGDYAASATTGGHDEVGQLAGAFSSMTRAIAEREEHIRYQAEHDTVTALPNRQAAELTIQNALAAKPPVGALLMIGLTRLPEIIQTMGHALSDRLMRDAAARLRPFAAGGFVARATDTQFSLWLGDADRSDAITVASRVLDSLGAPYQEADLAIDTTPAIGIALHPLHGDESSTLLRRAEIAMIAALGVEEPISVYDPATDPNRPERLTLMTDLREALDGGQLQLWYQPKLRLADGRIDGAEALLRWRHPLRGMVAPDTFVPLAERTGNIRRLTRWVMERAIVQLREWNALGHSLRVSINLSARDLDDRQLPARVSELLASHGVSPRDVVLELTESAIMDEPETALHVLQHLADLGIDLAIDDFGIGQSSFAYLRRLPVRELKIDRLFTQKLDENTADRTLVRSIVELGHRLGYHVTAEGIETRAAFDYLRDIGCDHLQGYLVSPALDAIAFEAMFAAGPPRAANGAASA